jgi:hypothetical protein
MYNDKFLKFKSQVYLKDDWIRYHAVKTFKMLKECKHLKIFKGKYGKIAVYDYELETREIDPAKQRRGMRARVFNNR